METYYLREISQNIRNFYPATGRQQILDRLLDDTIDTTILDSGVAEYITNNIYCNLTVIGDTFNAMRIESMAGLFLIFGVITILALLPLVWSKRCRIKNYFHTLKKRIHVGSEEKDTSIASSNHSPS